MTSDPQWYKDALIYELHVRAFQDSNHDGIGDFPGLIQKLDYLQDLGITCLWLLPFYPSPLRDDGYDIADYYDVHPSYGTRQDFEQFVREAHARGLRVITELVVNHTSDQHPWFRAARAAPAGSPERDYYVWSDTEVRYAQTRIIFTDSEKSNWTWDPVAKAYYWHRFFYHQPDLNYDNPDVLQAVFKVMRFWLDMGVDGLRLDAIPYLIEREGTNCENLPESHAILKKFRREMDARYDSRMLLAEANQWPADVLPYFGDGDECHMSFHFPLMPRIFMALRQEDRHPIVEIMRQTPEIPPECQWAIFLRNHDELTLEMVTDEERDYMYREYAADPQMRLNLGIRRRLAPLIGNSRLRIELLNSLLLSFPGTPVMYYGDEIGMGDNVYLGDRNGVRTPMQWTGDRNGGFSRADFNQLYSPPIMDPVYGYQAINVEAQQRAPSSLLNWMKRLIALRKRFKAFGRGSLQFLHPANRKILVYLRQYDDELLLCVVNLSRFTQPVELDLTAWKGFTPVELFGRVRFPIIGDAPYFLTLGPTSFMWFQLEPAGQGLTPSGIDIPSATAGETLVKLPLKAGWEGLMEGPMRARLERTALPRYLQRQRWYGGRTRTLETMSIRDWLAVTPAPAPSFLMLVDAYYSDGSSEMYLMPIAGIDGPAAEQLLQQNPQAAMAQLDGPFGAGVLYDAVASDAFCAGLFRLLADGQERPTLAGALRSFQTADCGELRGDEDLAAQITRLTGEQSNSTILYGRRLILKLFRRIANGTNPEFEVGRFLTERTNFDRIARTAGALEYHRKRGEPRTLAVLQQYMRNQGQGWQRVQDELGLFYERVATAAQLPEVLDAAGAQLLSLIDVEPPAGVRELVGSGLSMGETLGRRTAELHLALASDANDPAFAVEPLTPLDTETLTRRLGEQAKTSFAALANRLSALPADLQALAGQVLKQGPALIGGRGNLGGLEGEPTKFRCHGDYHLGQVLWVENDFVIVDFEGEPSRSIAERRAKQSPFKDVCGMLRSFDYAAYSELLRSTRDRPEDFERLAPSARLWRTWTSARFLSAYLRALQGSELLPCEPSAIGRLLEFFMLDKLLFELQYELNYRPDWVRIPLLALQHLHDSGA